jgi:putative ABC transport system ATP-binding protein
VVTVPDALVLDGVSKVYEVGGIELVALHDVDLAVAGEEVVTLLGPSGSGKTTLLSIAGGLLSATTGKVVVGGKNITRARARKLTAFRRKRIGFIFQAVNLVPFLTARENLLVVAELARRDRAAAARRADRLLDELGLGHRMNNLPSQLSGGERQRVAIGRALMNQPALVLVDEPTSALDSDLGQQVMELIVAEVKARGAAAVIVTHDQRMARYGDRILTMADGRIAGMAPRPEFTLGREPAPAPAPAAALGAGPGLRALPAASAGAGFGTAPASGRIPAAGGRPTAPASGRFPAAAAPPPAARAPEVDHAAPPPFPDHGTTARRDTGTVPAGLWANGPAVTPGIDRTPPPAAPAEPAEDGRRHTGQRSSTARDFASFWGEEPPDDAEPSPRSRHAPPPTSPRDAPDLGDPGPDAGVERGAPGAPARGTGQHPAAARDGAGFGGSGPGGQGWGVGPGTGQHPASARDGAGFGPRTGQAPVVPAPDRVWRRPATPPSGRPTGGRRPPPLSPAPAALPVEGWPDPEPQVEVPTGPPVAPAAWGTPEFFAEPPPGPAGHHPATPRAAVPPPGGGAEVVDEAESDRVRWLQQLTPPPTKAQPRPLALPDHPIWPTSYWGGASQPGAPGADDGFDGYDDGDDGEYDGYDGGP